MVAVYIINRLPTPVLDNKTPYECLYGDLPDYSVMKIFGCLAFSTNPTHTTDKFDPRGVPCVFLGYPALQKGYRLLNLLTMQTFVSRDVIFNELVFPYKSTSETAYMTPTPQVHPPTTSPFKTLRKQLYLLLKLSHPLILLNQTVNPLKTNH